MVDDAVFGPALSRERERVALERQRDQDALKWPSRLGQMTRLVHAALLDSGLRPTDQVLWQGQQVRCWKRSARQELPGSHRFASGFIIITADGALLFDWATMPSPDWESAQLVAALPWTTEDRPLTYVLDAFHLEIDHDHGIWPPSGTARTPASAPRPCQSPQPSPSGMPNSRWPDICLRAGPF